MRFFQKLAQQVHARARCGSQLQYAQHHDAITQAVIQYMPKSGEFRSVSLDERSTGEELVFTVNYFHPEDDNGKWTPYTVFVKPSLLNGGFKLSVQGLVRGDLRPGVEERITDAFKNALELAVD